MIIYFQQNLGTNIIQLTAVSKKAKIISENIILAYFVELAEKLKPPSLWATYSMLKTTLKTSNNIDIAKFLKVAAFLKRKSDGYKGKNQKFYHLKKSKNLFQRLRTINI